MPPRHERRTHDSATRGRHPAGRRKRAPPHNLCTTFHILTHTFSHPVLPSHILFSHSRISRLEFDPRRRRHSEGTIPRTTTLLRQHKHRMAQLKCAKARDASNQPAGRGSPLQVADGGEECVHREGCEALSRARTTPPHHPLAERQASLLQSGTADACLRARHQKADAKTIRSRRREPRA